MTLLELVADLLSSFPERLPADILRFVILPEQEFPLS